MCLGRIFYRHARSSQYQLNNYNHYGIEKKEKNSIYLAWMADTNQYENNGFH